MSRPTRFLPLWILLMIAVTPLFAKEETGSIVKRYAADYPKITDARTRLQKANKFFALLYDRRYLDEQIVFPEESHMDSVDVNVYFYIAEWYYGEGEFQKAVDYCLRAAERCTDKVDEDTKGDVYSQLGGAYFRLSEFEKAVQALNVCYQIDSRGGNPDQLSSTLNNIAGVLIAAGKPQEAEKYVLEAIAANGLTDNLARRAVIFGTASEMYHAMEDNNRSLVYARKALDIERQRGDSAKIGVRLSQVANAELGMGKIKDAKRSLCKAMPLLETSGQRHSLGICLNQMGDILSAEEKNPEAAEVYRRAVEIFLAQGDIYNESHAREGLYKVLKVDAPGEAMMHLERAKTLHDSIYQTQTGEALSRYNAMYYNDILQIEKKRMEKEKHVILAVAITVAVILILVITCGFYYARNREKRARTNYQDKINEAQRRYQNVVADHLLAGKDLTEDDRRFLTELAAVISTLAEQGISDIPTVAKEMHIPVATLRRRLAMILSETPQEYILRVRMEKAKHLLHEYREITVSQVAERCGYSQLANFSRAFYRFYGINPTDAKTQRADSETPKA